MSKISDEELDGLIDCVKFRPELLMATIRHETQVANESALRELLDYRKAVREYLSAVDAMQHFETADLAYFNQAEATLRALEERT